ncbi:2-methoxy-6-polyprenyl-1,4-benzoquinol methylase, mitochondrial [Neolewinella maritima]|uniref:2-methoxy-6-polyprenyl-1,4-benzoquinol methylase, mitochondrial n=1 Tax=Neolewinella maritima TaxID=1383882 RepID=A0ABM9B078_9BACT|nr:methyltransferase domain-containing protein [Neolewinella maritima]CAH1000488.1 2-methoxy-6-polyprenyl-1,4-benzoquinol methylase, mitochondrial [Neolewinella maritima]
MRLMQHKREAFWFYRYLSNFYDKLVNPLFWTERMREKSLDVADWSDGENLRVVDVGSGTGFTTQGIVKRVPAGNVVCVDQSPQQMERAMVKPDLERCRFRLGDAENLPFDDDTFDRYVSAGSIEYWPDPQRGLNEAYRVIKEGGQALMIGPIEPVNPISKFIANTWMLFPPENDYHMYFHQAGFTEVDWAYIRPHWQDNERYGIAIVGTKPKPGKSPNAEGRRSRQELVSADPEGGWLGRNLLLTGRVLLGSAAGFLFIPMALLAHVTAPLRGVEGEVEPLNKEQKIVLGALGGLLTFFVVRALTRKR